MRHAGLRLLSGLLLAAGLAQPLGAQLDSTCMVSALNRTAPVDENGIWLLPNVPADLGLLRIRATCVSADGTVTSGASASLYTVPANGIVSVSDIVFQSPAPIPTTLTLASAFVTFNRPGQTAQLALTATYSDTGRRPM
jgi:hypothetical protein